MNNNSTKILGAAVIVLLVFAVGLFFVSQNQGNNNGSGLTTTQGTTDTTTGSTSSEFKNGTYNSSGSYESPAGTESIDVSLTISDDTITAVTVTPRTSDPKSQSYQTLFSQGIRGRVVGKKLDEIGSLGNVNGSSLTPQGFQNALDQIKSEAAN